MESIERGIWKFAAIDQSYNECGIAIFNGTELVEVTRLNFALIEKKIRLVNKKYRMRNRYKREIVRKCIQKLEKEGVQLFVVERVRHFSRGMIAMQSIVALSELIATMIDACPELRFFSIDTRSWKAKSVGKGNASKQETIDWAESEKITDAIRKKRGGRPLTDNEADAIGLGIGFIQGCQIIEEE